MSGLHLRLFPIGFLALTIMTVRCGDDRGPTGPSAPSNRVLVANVSPATGPTVGANTVRIMGSAFQPGATVMIGDQAVPATVQSSSLIVVTMPAHEAGAVDVVVTNPTGETARLGGGYTYVFIPPPVITNVQPLAGATIGGTPVTITGTGFRPGASVSIGGAVASAFVQSNTTIYVTTNSHAPENVPVLVMNPDNQSATFAEDFTFADASTFDFNGDWEGAAYLPSMSDHLLFRLKVRDNLVVSVVCLRGEEVILSPAPEVHQGRFTFAGAGGATMTGVILSPGYAEGTINIAPCNRGEWDALKRSATSSTSGR
jgi:hypothetical protein